MINIGILLGPEAFQHRHCYGKHAITLQYRILIATRRSSVVHSVVVSAINHIELTSLIDNTMRHNIVLPTVMSSGTSYVED